MDGNDLNPVINTNGPIVRGPDPEPLQSLPNVTLAGETAGATNGAATPTADGQAAPAAYPQEAVNAAIASAEEAEAAKEKQAKLQKIVALVVTAVCIGFAVVALAIVVLANIPRIAALENRLDTIAAENKSLQAQVTELSKRVGYDIDVTFYDGLIPGTTYEVTLQPDTREVIVAAYVGCSLTDIAECEVEPETAQTILSVSEYNLVAQVYSNIDGSAISYTKNMLDWTNAILGLIGGDEVIADVDSPDWEIIKIYDADGDGTVSNREYGTYLLTQMIK